MDIKAFKFICGLILFCIIILGILGNILSFLVWSKGIHCRTLPGSFYLIALAVSDIFALCMTATYYAVDFVFEVNLTDVNVFMCKLLNTTWHFTLLVSTWIVVCLTVERALVVCWPLKSARWTNKRKPKIIILVLIVVCFIPNIPWTVGNRLLPSNTSNQKSMYGTTFRIQEDSTEHDLTTVQEDSTKAAVGPTQEVTLTCQSHSSSFIYKYETEWHKWFIDFGLLFTVPLIIISFSNFTIIKRVCKRNKKLHMTDSYRHTHGNAVSTSMTARVIAISLVHCVSVGPYSIAVLIPEFIQNVDKSDSVTCMYVVFTFIWYINHGANFILYSLFGSAFRRDCYDLLCKSHRHDSYRTDTSKFSGMELLTVTSVVSP